MEYRAQQTFEPGVKGYYTVPLIVYSVINWIRRIMIETVDSVKNAVIRVNEYIENYFLVRYRVNNYHTPIAGVNETVSKKQ